MSMSVTAPNNWSRVPLGSVGAIVTGSTPSTSDRSNYGQEYLFASPADLGRAKYITTTGKMLSTKGFSRSRKVPAGSTLFVCIGSTIGKVGIASKDLATNQQINCIIPNHGIDREYLYYAATTLSSLVREQAGEQAVPLVNKSNFSNFEILLPPVAEQRAIANALGHLDDQVSTLERQITKKQAIKQGMMQQLLRPQAEWTSVKLADVADVIDPHPSHRAPAQTSHGVLFVGIGDLSVDGRLITSSPRCVSSAVLLEHATRYRLEDGILGLGRVASIGKVVRFERRKATFAVSPTMGLIRPKLIPVNFAYYALQSSFVTSQFNSLTAGSTRSSIGMESLRRLNVSLPPLEIAVTIGETLTCMDDLLGVLRSRLAKAKAIKQGMMQELLTGRTRLPVSETAS